MNLDVAQMSLDPDGNPRHAFFDDVLFGMRERARVDGFHLLLLTTLAGTRTGVDVPYLDLCRHRALDGIVLVSYLPEENGLIELVQSDLPCVAIDTRVFGPRSGFVTSDNVGGAAQAVHHLATLGRRRIAFIGGSGPERTSVDRRLGYESALAAHGLELLPEYVRHAHWDHTRAREEARRLLRLSEPPDALFVASDRMAIGVMAAIEEAGLRVPEDVAVVGFDDSDLARLVAPPLSSVRQDVSGLGATAIELLGQILSGAERASSTLILPTELVLRRSSSGSEPRKRRLLHRRRPAEHWAEPDEGRIAPAELHAHLVKPQHLAKEVLERIARPAPSSPGGERALVALATITVPHQDFRHAYFDDLFYALRAHAFACDVDLLTLTSLEIEGGSESIPLLELARRHGALGVILLSMPLEQPETAALVDSDLPCVVIGRDVLGHRTGFVTSDNVDGAVQAVRHLGESGCRRVAFLGGHGHERSSIDRRFGYQSELARLGLEQRDDYICNARWDHRRAYEETRRLLALRKPPDAIFAASDVMAIGVIAAIEALGLRCPDDVKVVGFDDIELARLLSPSLSSVRQDRMSLAGAALDSLLRMVESPDKPPPVSVQPVRLIVRESSGGHAPGAPDGRPLAPAPAVRP
ncbi:MAG: substrate-binding domain-containing protein [Gaiellaceae bacterium]